jgi:hypothetical protein
MGRVLALEAEDRLRLYTWAMAQVFGPVRTKCGFVAKIVSFGCRAEKSSDVRGANRVIREH